MSVIETFTKQPGDTQDYDIDFSDYLAALADTAVSHTLVAEPGITIPLHVLTGNVVKVWASGGTDGSKYKITATITTTGGRVKEADILIKVKDD